MGEEAEEEDSGSGDCDCDCVVECWRGWGKNSLERICAGAGGGRSVEWISCRCFLYGYSYSLYSRVQRYRWDSMKNI